MGSCVAGNPKIVESSTPTKLLSFSYTFNIHKRYHFQRVISHGAFGQVKLYSDRIFSGTEYAIKCISKNRVKPNKTYQIKNEVEILSSLDHPNIVKYFCTVEDTQNFYLLMEYLSGKDLYRIFKEDYNRITLENIRFILFQVFSALSYLHSKGIVHRDIKPANIICAKNNGKFDLKLIDFGLSVSLDKRGKSPIAGSPAYLSPEGLKEIIHTKNDMWACGVMFYWYIFGKMPFEKEDRKELYDAIIKEEIEYDKNIMRPHIPKEAIDLCKKLLTRDFDERISASDALKHPFFKKMETTDELDDKILEDFFTQEKIKYIRLYNFGNIIKKTFVYVYSMLSSYTEEENIRQIFMTLEKKLSEDGTLNAHELYKEFKQRNLVKKEDYKAFSFVDPNKTRRVKKLLSDRNTYTLLRNGTTTKKDLVLKDWGTISYTIFICFYYIEEFLNNKKDCYQPRVKYIFELMSNQEQINYAIEDKLRKLEEDLKKEKKEIDEIKEILKKREMELNLEHKCYITKNSFLRFIYKYSLPFQDEKEIVDKFFENRVDKEKIKFEEFETLIQ